jgi:alanine racemase
LETSPGQEPAEAQRLARLEIDGDGLVANWARFARLGAAEVAAVVKADAYGLGAARCVRALASAGARTFFTATVGEAACVRKALGAQPAIFALNPTPAEGFARLAAADATIVLNCLAETKAWLAAGRPGRGCALHLDTGMNRLGAPPEEWAAIAAALPRPDLVMSHLACADAPGDPMTQRQANRFAAAARELFPGVRRSLAASAGALLGPAFAFDMIRPGIGLYGGLTAASGEAAFAPVVRLLAPILQVRTIAPGETVGYGATFTAVRETRIAVIGAGYADGVLRALSGRGYGVLGGLRCPFAGRVSMDLITLDVTQAGDAARPGAEIELLGPNAPLIEAAENAGTLSYEILTALKSVARTYHGAGA